MKDFKKVGGIYYEKKNNMWPVYFPWLGQRRWIREAFDGSRLDTEEKAKIVLAEIRRQMELGMFNITLWDKRSEFKSEWELRQLEPNYDKVGVCAICGEKTKICRDHDHKTKLVRGQLCNNCNLGLGVFKENKEALLNAVRYLLFWERQDLNRETYDNWKKAN